VNDEVIRTVTCREEQGIRIRASGGSWASESDFALQGRLFIWERDAGS
jgi:hypothetical protein